jgi:long-subunit acyl-CoA synthetase (AMP-forming)
MRISFALLASFPSSRRVISSSSHSRPDSGSPARSPDNGLLTPAMKLARPSISKAYENEIKASLDRGSEVVSLIPQAAYGE